MQGNCSSDDVGDLSTLDLNMTAWSLGMCLIVTDFRLMKVEQNLWIDNLYIRYLSTWRSDDPLDVVWCGKEHCNLWVTNSSIQGNGRLDPLTGGIAAAGGQIYTGGVRPGSRGECVAPFGNPSAVLVKSVSLMFLTCSHLGSRAGKCHAARAVLPRAQ